MREYALSQEQVKRALSTDYNEPLMRVNPNEYSDRREIPKYRLSEVALYLGMHERTLHNWFFGYSRSVHGEIRPYPGIIEPALHNPHGPALSFYNLAEAQVLSAIRQKWMVAPEVQPLVPGERPKFGQKPPKHSFIQVSMQAVRYALEYVTSEQPLHPLISQYFYSDGKNLFVRKVEEAIGRHLTVNVSRFGQMAFSSILDMYLDRIERDKSGPIKVYPLRSVEDEDKSIVIMPNVASGRPTVNGTGIRVEVIWNRSRAGETTAELAEDYGIEPRVIEKAISYFTTVKAA